MQGDPVLCRSMSAVLVSPGLHSDIGIQAGAREFRVTIIWQKMRLAKKTSEKNTYPPPADGVCVLFLCKAGSSASEAAGRAVCGASRVIGHFTECKVLKGNEARLHCSAVIDYRGQSAGAPVFAGGSVEKLQYR